MNGREGGTYRKERALTPGAFVGRWICLIGDVRYCAKSPKRADALNIKLREDKKKIVGEHGLYTFK